MPRRERQPARIGGLSHKAALAAKAAAEQRIVRLGAAQGLEGTGGDHERRVRLRKSIRSA